MGQPEVAVRSEEGRGGEGRRVERRRSSDALSQSSMGRRGGEEEEASRSEGDEEEEEDLGSSGFPVPWHPGDLPLEDAALGVGHHGEMTPVLGAEAGDAARRAVGVEGIPGESEEGERIRSKEAGAGSNRRENEEEEDEDEEEEEEEDTSQ
eukprot:762699-Hanusia_phi.AAC.3